MKNIFKEHWVLFVVGFIATLGLFLPLGNQIRLGALPVFNIFQLVSPTGLSGNRYGVVMSDGTSYGNLNASSTPTVKGIVATSSIQLTTISATGCAQFDTTGTLGSTGTACAASASGKVIDMYAATTSLFATNSKPATTTSATNGNTLQIFANCQTAATNGGGTVSMLLQVGMSGKGTTTLSKARVLDDTAANIIGGGFMMGLYTASSTANVFVAIDDGNGNLLNSCNDYNIMINRFTN